MKRIFTLFFLAMNAMHGSAQNCNPLDQSFGIGGKSTGVSGTNYIYLQNLIVQPDGKIIQVGGSLTGGNYHFTVLRYNSNGSVDNGFGQNGTVVTTIAENDQLKYAALQTDGKIVAVGFSYNASYHYDMVMVRYNPNGTLDSTFGVGGKVLRSLGAKNNSADGLAIQPDGKIIIVGAIEGNCFTDCWGNLFCSPAFAVARFNNNGSIDSSFGQNGIVTTNVGPVNVGRASSAIIQPDGKIVVAGAGYYDYACDYYGGWYYSSNFAMVRYHPNGSRDSSFGKNGIVYDSVNLVTTSGLAAQTSGKIVAMGPNRTGGFVTKRFNADGSLDNSFGQQGRVITAGGWSSSLATLPNGKIVIAGNIYRNGKENFQVIRLTSDGSFDNTFNATGTVNFHPGTPASNDAPTGIGLQGAQLIVGGISSLNNTSSYSAIVVRLLDSVPGLPITITSSGSLTPCPGELVRLVSSESGTIQWYSYGSPLNGAIDTVYSTYSSGQYTVSVQNAKGCGESAPVTVNVNGLPVVITPGSSLNFCTGDSVRLVSSEAGTLQWFRNGVGIPGSNDTVYVARTPGTYTVSAKNTKGCGISTPATVIVNPITPIVNWDATQARLTTVSGYYGYQWYLNGNPIAGANASFFQPIQTGTYRVVISDYKCNNTSDELILDCNLAGVPKPSIAWNGSQLVTLPGYGQYEWYLNGTAVAGAYSSFLQPVQVGIYKVKITNSLNCSNTSDEFNVGCSVLGPSKPPINWTNSYSFSTTTGYAHYQWSLNGSAIAGSDSSSYKPAASGLYAVTVTNSTGCSNTSDNFNLVVLGISDITVGDAKLRYYPNPAHAVLNVDIASPASRKLQAEIYDLPGRLVQKQSLSQRHNQLSIQRLPAGLYQLVITNGLEKTAVKVLVIK